MPERFRMIELPLIDAEENEPPVMVKLDAPSERWKPALAH